jgi:hypothetical protein
MEKINADQFPGRREKLISIKRNSLSLWKKCIVLGIGQFALEYVVF